MNLNQIEKELRETVIMLKIAIISMVFSWFLFLWTIST